MPAGALLTAYAYHVFPGQSAEFSGGLIPPTDDLAAALDSTFDRSKVATAPVVNLRIDPTDRNRSHPIRDAARAISFSSRPEIESVKLLATRLSEAMDNRSKPSLLMVSVHASTSADSRRFILWTFPQQEVFNLSVSDEEARLDIVEAFIRESSLRKVAYLEGNNTNTGMLTARVLDFQATAIERSAADLWIVKFLDARLQMNSGEGTRMLARALRMAYDRTAGDQRAQDELGAALAGVRVSGQQRLSVDGVANSYLGPVAKSALQAGLGADARAAMFELDTDVFDQLIQFRRFTLETGVVVSAPFVEIGSGTGIEVTDVDGKRRLKAEGDIANEQVRARG